MVGRREDAGAGVQSLMCTIGILYKVLDDYPLAVVMTREARHDHPEKSPREIDSIFGPEDGRSGMWIAMREGGIAALANRQMPEGTNGYSRGGLVRLALMQDEADLMDKVYAHPHHHFNLVTLTMEKATLLEYDGELGRGELAPGIHVVTSVPLDDPGRVEIKTLRMHKLLNKIKDSAALIEAAQTILGDHEYEHGTARNICVHDHPRFLTRSGVAALYSPEESFMLYCHGKPCETKLERFTHRQEV